jgi:hypothetical protein
VDEIRTEVWDYLYKNGPASLETIASASGRTVQTIQAATEHEWFAMRGDVVAIATRQESRCDKIRSSEEESSRILRNLFSSEGRTSER